MANLMILAQRTDKKPYGARRKDEMGFVLLTLLDGMDSATY